MNNFCNYVSNNCLSVVFILRFGFCYYLYEKLFLGFFDNFCKDRLCRYLGYRRKNEYFSDRFYY